MIESSCHVGDTGAEIVYTLNISPLSSVMIDKEGLFIQRHDSYRRVP